jgi:hypothetical protein
MNQISKFLMFTLLQSCPILYLFCGRRDSQAIFSEVDKVFAIAATQIETLYGAPRLYRHGALR